MKNFIQKIVAGGQTGVDRAALDTAMTLGIAYGGWCPKGRQAEDGVIPSRYHLKETSSARYSQRTKWNVRDSDGVLVIVKGSPMGGTLLTIAEAQRLKKPYWVLDLAKKQPLGAVVEWIDENNIRILDVAGPRASETAGIYRMACGVLQALSGSDPM